MCGGFLKFIHNKETRAMDHSPARRDVLRAASAGAASLAARFAKQTGKQLVIDNKGGAGGTVGASVASRMVD
jgi:hypothetical protein